MTIDIKYKKNFLTNVICRIDFSPILELLSNIPDEFQKQIKEILPEFKQNLFREFTTKIEKNTEAHEKKESPLFIFSDKHNEKKVSFNYDHLIIEVFKYKDFESFKELAQKAIESFITIYRPVAYSRLGLRYINQIILEKGNPFDWKNYIDPSLTYVVAKFIDDKKNLARAMNQIILNRDDYKMNFIYGLHNSEFPDKIRRKEFILDFDCYTEYFDKENIFEYLEKFNTEIGILFEKSIKEKLRDIMGVINE